MNHWIVTVNHLAIQGQDSEFHLNAEEIYSYFDGSFNDRHLPSCGDPHEEISEIRFSKIGSQVKCRLFFDDEQAAISIEIFVNRRGVKIPVDLVTGIIIDQCVFNNEWFYVTGDLASINNAIHAAEIITAGKISLRQYLRFIAFCSEQGIHEVINDVQPDDLKSITELVTVPQNLKANLYDYQKIGFFWMSHMILEGCGCILGDEMGLGKTLQVIALITKMKPNTKEPILVIAPVSLLENWRRECQKFSPLLQVFVHHGSSRTGHYKLLLKYDVIIISYNTAVSDLAMLKMIDWPLVVVDEAQNIKNPYSERAKSVKDLPRTNSIAITGTPFENHITDIWSLADFVMPGYFGHLNEFKASVSDDLAGAEIIEPLLSPIMIRRLVKDVAQDLPEKVIISQPLVMPDKEAVSYERIRQEIIDSGTENVQLAMLQKLRVFCTHPFISDKAMINEDPCYSLKYQRLCEIVQEIVASNEKVIVFTSYKAMFDIFNNDIPNRFGIPIWNINGETPIEDRQAIVDKFNEVKTSAFLALNPRAAGTGLNITGANHVIHYNLEWNPALEDQASARAYRRGQTKTVFIYRLFYTNTVEEIVNQRIENKREIAGTAIVGTNGKEDSRADIIAAIEMTPFK